MELDANLLMTGFVFYIWFRTFEKYDSCYSVNILSEVRAISVFKQNVLVVRCNAMTYFLLNAPFYSMVNSTWAVFIE